MKREFGHVALLLWAAFFFTLFANLAFFRALETTLEARDIEWLRVLSAAGVLYCLTLFTLALMCSRKSIKPVLLTLFTIAALSAYFMDSFNVIIDAGMLANLSATDSREVRDLLTWRLLYYVILLAVIPSAMVLWLRLRPVSFRHNLWKRVQLAGGSLLVAVTLLIASSGFYASLIREHKTVRYYSNPLTPLYSAYRFVTSSLGDGASHASFQALGEDAHIPPMDIDRELIVMVVGETARADHFSLNGYERPTNPLLARTNAISFTNVTSCGTSTAVSVPCMFSNQARNEFDGDEFGYRDNLLDVVNHAGVHVLWRDNNSDSKGVAERVPVEDFRNADVNPACDIECRDIGMLSGLQKYVDTQEEGDILIVLHQMGSHGPAYFKRYPAEFRKFAPTCDTIQLDQCSVEEIVNAYDNSILYTDYFLSRVVAFLQDNDERFETAMMYISDHGESLGELGLYLHSAPYIMAPKSQTRVPMVLWFGSNYDGIEVSSMDLLKDEPTSHDDIFNTVLSLFEIRSDVYREDMDLLNRSRKLSGIPNEYP